MNIHNLTAPNSASEIEVRQYLALKVLWRNQKQTEMEEYLETIGFEKGIFEKKRSSMNNRKAWRLYIKAIRDNTNSPPGLKPYNRFSILSDDLGGFQLVLHDQLEVLDLSTTANNVAVSKAQVMPMLERLRPRHGQLSDQLVPQTPQQHSMFNVMQDVSASKHDEPKFPDAKDEQIVNSALVNFLHAVWIDEERNAEWKLKRKEFRFCCRDTGTGFTARTDGHLEMRSHFQSHSAGILEVKARARPRKDPGDHKIEMQESAQMTLWIAQEPESHWISPLRQARKDVTDDQF
jgi:hypothetical protein